jgi:hypothetical protein
MNPKRPIRDVSPERKKGYSVGMVMTISGGLLFGMGFLISIVNFGNFDHFESTAKGAAFCWFLGMGLLVAGSVVRNISAKGMAGSGMVLDPQKARKDLEPLSREMGGIVNDALSEVDVTSKLGTKTTETVQVIKVKCSQCSALNDEDAQFCKSCGGKI